MKEKYIELMERSLSAYSDEHILRYFNDVKTNGLTEHGFPRLTVCIGILNAHARRMDLFPLFLEMMEFCCKTIPCVKAANDFSVREIVCCLLEIEDSKLVSKEITKRWRKYLAAIEPTSCYNKFATSPTDTVRNWALFTAVSEYFRLNADIGGSMDFIELQLCQQLQWIDENGMYMDNASHEKHQPIVYDTVPRELFSLLLARGYRGKYYTVIDNILKKSGLLTLGMQSPNGEIAFGGRSNQFLHNETTLIHIFEYEAKRYAKEGDYALAARFKAASARALAVIEEWLNKEPIRHIKNRYPTETGYGCEKYAYFDKYMVTVASGLYAAYLLCDDSIPFEPCKDLEPCVTVTSEHFHKLFLKSGGYGLEFDLDADPNYDANGLGRIHKDGAPCAIAISSPCPSAPKYTLDIEKCVALSACSAIKTDDIWMLGAEVGCTYEIISCNTKDDKANAELCCHFTNGNSTKELYTVDTNGISVTVCGNGEIGFTLPALDFDGEKYSEISTDPHSLSISYDGWICRYTTDGNITDMNRIAANRNGHYRVLIATAQNTLNVKIEIIKKL